MRSFATATALERERRDPCRRRRRSTAPTSPTSRPSLAICARCARALDPMRRSRAMSRVRPATTVETVFAVTIALT